MIDTTYLPINDGIDHINIYSKGNTELGKLLSNFARTPIQHPEFGYFESIEAFWYWLATGMIHDNLRPLYGLSAKYAGKEYPRIEREDFQDQIKKALRLKLEQHDNIRAALVSSTLPLSHYFWYGKIDNPKVHVVKQYNWITEEWVRLRTEFVEPV